jgi:hypothetical protein
VALLLKVKTTFAPVLAVRDSLANCRSSLLTELIFRVTLPPLDEATVVAVGAGDVAVGSSNVGDVAVAAGEVAVGLVVGAASPPPQAKPTIAVTTNARVNTQVFFTFPPHLERTRI